MDIAPWRSREVHKALDEFAFKIRRKDKNNESDDER